MKITLDLPENTVRWLDQLAGEKWTREEILITLVNDAYSVLLQLVEKFSKGAGDN